jgi:VIT1/CCC1 family predicted Fe2+/Mn2+ transporter
VTLFARLFRREHLFPLVIGPVDGILTALTLAAGRFTAQARPLELSLAVRIALAASLSGGFVFFVAEYARLRGQLVHAEQHLNLAAAGRLARSHLGSDVLRESLRGALVAAATGFGGAMPPLALGVFFPAVSWLAMAMAMAIAVLGLLGIAVARAVHGSPAYWAIALMAAGVLLSAAGIVLHVA